MKNYLVFSIIILSGVFFTTLLGNNQVFADSAVQIDPASIYYNDSGHYVPYKLIQDLNSATIFTKDGSYIFNKNTCTLSLYNNTSGTGTPVVNGDSYSVLTSLGNTGVWNPVNIINNAVCNTSIIENQGTISIIGTKSVSGAGVFSIN